MSKVLIIKNSDKRMAYIKKYLEQFFDVSEVKDDQSFYNGIQDKSCRCVILPVRGVSPQQIIDGTDILLSDQYLLKLKNKTVYTGLISKQLKSKCDQYEVKLKSYLTDDLAIKNNYITTEGIIEAIVNKSEKAIYDSKILILGYGRLGQICANVLKQMKAKVCVSCRHEKDKIHAKINEFDVVRNDEIMFVIDQYDFIINTIPYHIIDNLVIQKLLNQHILIIDVASKPYGLDHQFAKDNDIQSILLPGIPGKIAPKTAGELIGNVIYQDIGGGVKND